MEITLADVKQQFTNIIRAEQKKIEYAGTREKKEEIRNRAIRLVTSALDELSTKLDRL